MAKDEPVKGTKSERDCRVKLMTSGLQKRGMKREGTSHTSTRGNGIAISAMAL